MSKALNIFFLILFSLGLTSNSEPRWEVDLKEALKKADLEKKDVFAYFTGSDWCPLCKVLKKEVFDKEDFLEDLQKDFVLLKVDFPKKKPLAEVEQRKNDLLSRDYSIEGFPTVLLLDRSARAFAKTGYKDLPASEYRQHLNNLLKIKKERDELFKAAEALEGVDKARVLGKAMNLLGDIPKTQYAAIINDILKEDPEDKTGFKKTVVLKQKLAGLESQVIRLVEGSRVEEAQAAIKKFIEEFKPQGEERQKAMLYRIYTLEKDSIDVDEVEKYLDSIISVDPNTESANDARGVKEQVQSLRQSKKSK